jgi:site-specific DNA-methyltransferase (adenine-specific)
MKPYFELGLIALYHGDAREVLPSIEGGGDVVVTDPPYGDTSLDWDVQVTDWAHLIRAPQLWCFGSMRFFLGRSGAFEASGWRYAQDVVWEKHNGSSLHADRFRRVHEIAVHFYRGEWASLHKQTQTTPDATARTVRRKAKPPHWSAISEHRYASEDGGPRMMRSVLQVRSCHGYAIHPTQKPIGILEPLIAYSCPPGGLVVDPFAGSGSTLEAARGIGRRAIGIEIDERTCETAAKRLGQGAFTFGAAQ